MNLITALSVYIHLSNRLSNYTTWYGTYQWERYQQLLKMFVENSLPKMYINAFLKDAYSKTDFKQSTAFL